MSLGIFLNQGVFGSLGLLRPFIVLFKIQYLVPDTMRLF